MLSAQESFVNYFFLSVSSQEKKLFLLSSLTVSSHLDLSCSQLSQSGLLSIIIIVKMRKQQREGGALEEKQSIILLSFIYV